MSTLVWIIIWIGMPLIVASFIAHMVHLPTFTWRVALVVYAMTFSIVGLFPLSEAFRPGIDLSGGTILVYQVKQPTSPDFNLDKMVAAIHRRINPAGLMDVTLRGVGTNQVEIIIPRAKPEDVARCKRVLTSVGSLEFHILANRRDHTSLIEAAERTFPQPLEQGGKVLAKWLPIAPSGGLLAEYGEIVVQTMPKGQELVLVVIDDFDVTGELLSRAQATFDNIGEPAVGFHFDSEGAQRFGALTESNLPASDGFERRLAIILDGKVHSAPAIRDRISDDGIITGKFTQQEVDDLVSVLNAGSLPASLESPPASELSIGPTLGKDTVRSGLTAMTIATVTVLLFMIAYYRLAGLIADLAVMMNVLIVVGCMSWGHANWTLSGLAGLALSVGMAVDANVLIFERLREEQQKGRLLRQAIDLAFSRALRPILDSNITTLLAAGILYWIGSEQVKGFAMTLLIGLLANLFTAIFVCRLAFDVMERNGWVRRLGMFQLFQETSVDFVGKRWIAVAGSCLLIIVGLIAVGARGRNLLDIDFTGGTLAVVTLREPADSAMVRRMAGEVLPDVAIEELQVANQPPGCHFLIRTTLQNQEEVRRDLRHQFRAMLATKEFERLDNFGSQVAEQAQAAAALALAFSMVAIVVYLWIRFQNVLFGLGAVIALVHDVFVVLGLIAASYWIAATPFGKWMGVDSFKINLPMVAALLTLVGYSVNDTIVVFDRIREVRRKAQSITWEMINLAVNQTLSRTLLTSFTTWLVALILFTFGGTAIHGFAFCLVLGVLVGTYSSIYIASPLLVWLSPRTQSPVQGTKPAIAGSHDQLGTSVPHAPRRSTESKENSRRRK